MNNEATQFKKGNKAAVKCPKVVIRKFQEMIENAKTDNSILCFQDACMSIEWRCSKVNYWCSQITVFASLKKDIQDIIISRINKNSLDGTFNPTASIWRMKMLGETDSSTINHQNDGGKFETPRVVFKKSYE